MHNGGSDPAPNSWQLDWRFGRAEVQALGGMLGPLEFHLADGRRLQALHVAAWVDSPEAQSLPGILRRLRGEWPCLPFGRTDQLPGLPPGWQPCSATDDWAHGYGSNHAWTCISAQADHVHLAIDYPPDSAISRLERHLRVDPLCAALDVSLTIMVREEMCIPIALHPTFRMPAEPGRVVLQAAEHDGVISYPVAAEAGISRCLPDSFSPQLSAVRAVGGAADTLDLSRLPLPYKTEELLQLKALRAPAGTPAFVLHYLDEDVHVGLSWDTVAMPDLLLWISNGGRADPPWSGNHFALGVEPLNAVFDLTRVAVPPAEHRLAERQGIRLRSDQPWTMHYRFSAW